MAKRLRGVEPIERFNQKYIVNEETGCWEWQDSLDSCGYGRLTINNKKISAHRFSYEYFIGPLDSNLVICHQCNNRRCVNFKHLRQDTRSSNMIDMVYAKNQSQQKLSVDEVIEIKKALKHYYRGQCKDLSHFYKVNLKIISNIKQGNRWSHVEVD
jgi:hypothetical protein